MQFKHNLRLARENKGISIKSLAEAIDVKPYTISDWEKGRSEPNISNLIKLANYFNVTVDFLVGNTINSDNSLSEIIDLINNYQKTDYADELRLLLEDLSQKNKEKIINVVKSLKKEFFNK